LKDSNNSLYLFLKIAKREQENMVATNITREKNKKTKKQKAKNQKQIINFFYIIDKKNKIWYSLFG